MGNVSKALKKIFKIWKLLSQMVKRLQAIEEALDALQETRFVIDGELAADRACAVDALAEEIVDLEPYSTPAEVAEANAQIADLQRRLVEGGPAGFIAQSEWDAADSDKAERAESVARDLVRANERIAELERAAVDNDTPNPPNPPGGSPLDAIE